ncbi:MAG: TonB-dependent receptor [Burkholderiales bacterium]|nr:TonB-dependent receptor [Burkholderiales bacterium]
MDLSSASPQVTPLAIGAALATLGTFAAPAFAQSAAAPIERVAPVIVTANPLASEALAQPTTTLSGDALSDRRPATLGELLSGVVGVSATQFAPGASRPIVRGMDGERVRVLADGAHSHDASTLSFDHGVPLDPLTVERIEVLRGPATLLYGGGAIGGVVNGISNRIARGGLSAFSGDATLLFGTADRSRGSAMRVAAPVGGLNFTVDAATRDSDDVRVPEFTRPDGERTDRVANSASRTESGGVGLSWANARGHLGATLDTYRSNYGVVAEEDVTIRMRRNRALLSGAWRTESGPLFDVSGHLALTRYKHDEVEGSGEVGTTFRNHGEEFRLTATTRPLGGWRLAFGTHLERTRTEALGEEAFVPPADTRNTALFALAQRRFGAGELQIGLRNEQNRIRTQEVIDEEGHNRFGGAQSRQVTTWNASAGWVHTLSPTLTATANATLAERAPSYFERFADGVHVATGAYERGDPNLPVERGSLVDLGLAWKSGAHALRVNAFHARYRNFISLDATGERAVGHSHSDEPADPLPVYAFRAVPARHYGAEVEARARLLATQHTVDLALRADTVRATNRATGEPLPRIAPMRVAAELLWEHGPWRLRGEIRHSAAQRRIPSVEREQNAAGDGTTPAFTTIDLHAAWRFTFARQSGRITLAGLNLGNQLGYNATTLRGVRELYPLPARQVRLGLDLNW